MQNIFLLKNGVKFQSYHDTNQQRYKKGDERLLESI
jgi:hypothetical protein